MTSKIKIFIIEIFILFFTSFSLLIAEPIYTVSEEEFNSELISQRNNLSFRLKFELRNEDKLNLVFIGFVQEADYKLHAELYCYPNSDFSYEFYKKHKIDIKGKYVIDCADTSLIYKAVKSSQEKIENVRNTKFLANLPWQEDEINISDFIIKVFFSQYLNKSLDEISQDLVDNYSYKKFTFTNDSYVRNTFDESKQLRTQCIKKFINNKLVSSIERIDFPDTNNIFASTCAIYDVLYMDYDSTVIE